MQPNLFSIGSVFGNPFLLNADSGEDGVGFGFERSRLLFLVPFLLLQGVGGGGSSGGMDLSKVGEKILSSVRSARSLGLLPLTIDRPEVPARAAAAAAVARVLAGMPPHQRFNLPSSSEELRSIYGSIPQRHMVEELEEDFYEEDFDPVRHILEHVPSEENELSYFEEQNGRRHLTSSMNEVSRDLVVNTNSKRKQTLLDMLAVLTELRRALDMQVALESLVEEGNYCKAFQVLSEYLQLLDSFSELPAIQEMSRGVEVWLGRTLQKLDALLLGVCQEFKEESYITVVDAYALIGDISGLAEKLQSFYMQEVLSETHSVLKNTVQEDLEIQMQNSRLTYSDLSLQIPESKFRQCLLRTLAVLFRLISSYHEIMNFRLEHKDLAYQTSDMKQDSLGSNGSPRESLDRMLDSSPTEESTTTYMYLDSNFDADETRSNGSEASRSGSPWYHLRKDATAFVSQTLQRGRKNLWQLTTSRVSVLLSSAAISSMSTHQFLKNYEDLNVFILAGEAFCGVEAVEFRQKLKAVCENYFLAFHRQNIHALKMVLEKESWLKLPPDTVQSISFAGLVGNGAALIVPSHGISSNVKLHHSNKSVNSIDATIKKSGFTSWIKSGNPFSPKIISTSVEGHSSSLLNGATAGEYDGHANDSYHGDQASPHSGGASHKNGTPFSEDENEDLLADFIDEDSQLPSRISKPKVPKSNFSHCKDDEISAQTGSSLCLLRSMDKYARFMQKLEIVNVEFFKGICQLFEIFFYSVFETFGQQNSNSNGKSDPLNYRLKTAISRITQDCDQWIKPQLTPVSSSSPTSLSTYMHGDVTPASPPNHSTSFGLKERCAAADTISLVAQILHRSKTHLQSMLLQNNPAIVEDFFVLVVDSVPDVIEHLHRTTARLLLHINGRYVDRIANAKWEVKELGLEHNGYVDLLLGEFKHYKTRLAHGGIHKEAQDRLSEYGVEIVAETLIEGLSRVKRCSDEGRALMSLDLQVLINGLQHFVPINVKPKLQMVETFIKAYYLPETEYVHWARAHPEYTKNQIVGLINLVAAMKGWKRKTRLEVIEKIE
ncbi:PREDICTED: coiled-coil domain-containing protein 132 isoform X4 [Populus euphratica]|uniref:Coiled-coil domain-containing protein 132 isoform X4 n=1 Tax=Populus euphratica TaxID=75702 RepID=A0AAJ6X4V1_POPEU|nr:PREDICTED: coiled-coil domain-containing protein 132 isoform X4 [Populus euphratica]